MKIETNELIEVLKPFRNGCRFSYIDDRVGIVLKVGCCNYTNLASGLHKYLNEMFNSSLSSNGELKINHKYLVQRPITVKNKLREVYEKCKICEDKK